MVHDMSYSQYPTHRLVSYPSPGQAFVVLKLVTHSVVFQRDHHDCHFWPYFLLLYVLFNIYEENDGFLQNINYFGQYDIVYSVSN